MGADITTAALVLERPRQFRVRPVTLAAPSAGEVLVEPIYVGLCGTDLHIAHGAHPRARLPLVLGHEIVGIAAEGRWAGQAVVVDPTIACGACTACARGLGHVCEYLRLAGVDRQGGLAGCLPIAEAKLHPVPPAVPPEAAALAEPLAVAVHAADRAGPSPGARVVVLGGGPIGLLIALTVRARGAPTVVIAEPAAGRRHLAGQLGFETAADAETLAARLGGEPADVVFDAAGVPAAARLATQSVRPGGAVVIAGVHVQPAPLDLQAVTFRELRLLGTRVYRPEDIATALAMLAGDAPGAAALDVTGLISEVVDLEQVSGALGRLERGETLKVLVRCGGGPETTGG